MVKIKLAIIVAITTAKIIFAVIVAIIMATIMLAIIVAIIIVTIILAIINLGNYFIFSFIYFNFFILLLKNV